MYYLFFDNIGSLYVAHASLYLIIAFSSVINAVMMLVNRLEVSFYVSLQGPILYI